LTVSELAAACAVYDVQLFIIHFPVAFAIIFRILVWIEIGFLAPLLGVVTLPACLVVKQKGQVFKILHKV